MAYIVNLSNWDKLLQEDYVQGKIADAINTSTVFLDKNNKKEMAGGRELVYGVKVGASQGVGARADGGNMPAYGAGEYQDATVVSRYNYASFKITGPSETFSDRASFVRFGLQIVKDTIEGLRLNKGRQTWGDGQGTLCLVNGAVLAGASTITVDSAYGVLWGSLSTNTTFLVKRKMLVQFGTEDNGGLGYTVQTVGSTSFTITPILANNVADNATVSLLASANNEIVGALQFASTAAFSTTNGNSTTYNGINRTNYPEWEGNVVNAGAALSLTLIRSIRDAIYKRTDDEESNLMLGGTEIARDYEALLTPAQRMVPPMKLEGGYSALAHDGLMFTKDSKAPCKALWFFDTKHVFWAQPEDANWLKDSAGIMRVVPGQDAKEALYRYYGNIDVDEPRRQGILYNITTT